MIVQLLKDCEIDCLDYVGQDIDDSVTELFTKGTILEFDVISHPVRVDGQEDKNLLNVKFGDGSVCLSVSTEWFKVIEE